MHGVGRPSRRRTPASAAPAGPGVAVRLFRSLALALYPGAKAAGTRGPTVAKVVVLCATLSLALGLSECVRAQDDWDYVVVDGDNPWNLTKRYLDGLRYWPLLQQLNGIANPTRIPPGTRLRIPAGWLRPRPATAEVVEVSGAPRLERGSTDAVLKVGMRLESGDRVETPPGAAATLEFGDRSRVIVRGDSVLKLEQLVQFENTNLFRTRVLLERGRTENLVFPQRARPNRFESLTPSALTAVRGTEYRVSAEEDTARAEVLDGRVSVSTTAGAVDVPTRFGTVARGTALPLPPIPLLPPPDAQAVPKLVERVPITFPAPSLPGAVRLRLQIAVAERFDAPLFDDVTEKTVVRGPNLPDGRYTARLRGIDAAGLEGEDATFTIVVNARPEPPILVAPPPGGGVREAQPRLQWSESDPMYQYRVQVARDGQFADIVADEPDIPEGGYTVRQALEPGRYFWRVAAVDRQEGAGPFSNPQDFRRPPPGPALEPPAVGDEELVLRWRAGLPGQRFEVQLSASQDFREPLVDLRTDAAQVVVPRPEAGTYYMRVRTIDVDGFEGFFETPQRITVPAKSQPWWLLIIPLLPILLL